MLKSSLMPQCPAGLLIRVQLNTYIEKTEHFWTALDLVKQGKGTAEQRLQYSRSMGNSAKLCRRLLCCSGLRNKPHWKDFPSNWSVIKELVKYKTKQSRLRTFSTSRGPHLIPGEWLSATEQDALFEDLLKEHVDCMEQSNLLN
jgi:hypothetical protein